MSDNVLKKENFKWIRNPEQKGERLFTFDGKKVFSLYKDYPHKLSPDEKQIFDDLNPFWADYFKDRV